MFRRLSVICLLVLFLFGGWSEYNVTVTTSSSAQSISSSNRQGLSSSSSSSSNSRRRTLSSSGAMASNSTSERLKKRQEEEKKKAEEKAKAKEGQKKDDGKKTVTSKNAAPTGSSTTKKPTTATNAATTLNQFKIKPNSATNVLYMELVGQQPTLDIVVRKGEVFATRVVFHSGGMDEFDTLDVSLKYDPRIIEPIGIDDSAFSSRLAEPALARVDRNKGIIAWHCKFAAPAVVNTSEVFRVSWKALALSDKTTLGFLNTVDFPSRVLSGRRNILLPMTPEGAELGDDNEMDATMGLLTADITVVTDIVTNDQADETSGSTVVTTVGSSTLKLAREIADGTAEGKISLGMKSSTNTPLVGNDFTVTIYYENPQLVDFDRVRLTIDYNPSVLQVVDWDTDNWITENVNIYDGDFHDELPYDIHMRNQALNNVGKIYYEMGFTHRPSPAERGNLAIIKFRPIKTATLTQVSFDQIDAEEVMSPTALSFLGYNLVGVPGKRAPYYGKLMLSVAGQKVN